MKVLIQGHIAFNGSFVIRGTAVGFLLWAKASGRNSDATECLLTEESYNVQILNLIDTKMIKIRKN